MPEQPETNWFGASFVSRAIRHPANLALDISGEDGPFSVIYSRRFGDMLDGVSLTSVFSEKLRGDGSSSAITPEADIFLFSAHATTNEDYIARCNRLGSSTMHDSRNGYSWMLSGTLTTWYNHVATPNSTTPDCGQRGTEPYRGLFPARSWHFGGVHVLMGDTAVRFVDEEIDANAWRALGTRAGHEIVRL